VSAGANAPAPFHQSRSSISSNSATMLASATNTPAIPDSQAGGSPEASQSSTSSYFSPSSPTFVSSARLTSGGGAMGLVNMFNQPGGSTS